MRVTPVLLLVALAAGATDSTAQRPVRRTRHAPVARVTSNTIQFRCWSERPRDCAAAVDELLRGGNVRSVTRRPESGWTEDMLLTYRRAASIDDAADRLKRFVEELRPSGFPARVSLQSAHREWKYATEDGGQKNVPQERRAQGKLRRMKARTRAGDLELALTGKSGQFVRGTEHEVDGVLRNPGERPLEVRLKHGCDLDVAVTRRGSDTIASLSPCAAASQTIRVAPADSFVFRGANVPSDAIGSYTAYATLVGKVNGKKAKLRTSPLRIDIRDAGESDAARWASPRPRCVPHRLRKRAPDELAGRYMIGLAQGVDADALARYLVAKRKLRVAVSTPRYLALRGSDRQAAALACLAGVERVIRDVQGKE